MSQLIIVEGLIGAGKTTLTEQMARVLDGIPAFEPVHENPYLEKFYADPKRWALEMQFWLMSRRFKAHRDAVETVWKTGKTVIMDRSIYGDAVFCKRNYLDGNIDQEGYDNYLHMRDVMTKYLMVPQVTLYLSVKPENCNERIKLRGRGCEKGIPLGYLQGLDELYKELMVELSKKGSHVCGIEWDEFEPVESVIEKLKDYLGPKFEGYRKIS